MTPFKRTVLQLAITATLFPSIGLMAATPADPVKQAPTKVDATLPVVQVTGTNADEDSAILVKPKKTTTNISAPITKIRREDIYKTNAVSSGDALKYDSQLSYRQRYIGDNASGLSLRGCSNNQGGCLMVFADGLPLWNPLMAEYRGGPRLNLISSGEIKSVDIQGGPFNAEYSGNSRGGVINYTTHEPTKREIYTEATYMLQPSNLLGIDTNLQGFQTFGSYADKLSDKVTTFFSYKHLENEGQPMVPSMQYGGFYPKLGELAPASAAQLANPTTGGALVVNPLNNIKYSQNGPSGANALLVGSNGIQHITDDVYKWKGTYAITPELKTNLVLAYENFLSASMGQSLVKNTAGQTVWGSQLQNYSSNGYGFGTGFGNAATTMGANSLARETFTASWGLNGRVYGSWYNNTNVSYFDILNDTTLTNSYNPMDPIYQTAAGTGGTAVSQTGTGWYTVATKMNTDEFLGRKDLSFAYGYDYQHAHLTKTTNNLTNVAANRLDAMTPISVLSGGTTDTNALFAQASWRFLKDWDATPGVRLEHWTASDGIYQTSANMSGSLSPQDRAVNNWAPKFSLGYQPGNWKFRYSVAKAYRYALADELYGNSSSANGSQTIANATLKPEDGTHHNLTGEYDFENGYVRMNLYHENIQNSIYNGYIYQPGQSVLSQIMSSIGEVQTNGMDISAQFDRVMKSDVDVKLSKTLMNSTIVANPMNTSVVGNQMPFMPHYRANMLSTYHARKDLDLSVGTRYQSAAFVQPDNKDIQANYYGNISQEIYVDLKSTYFFNNKKGHVSAGIDNVNGYQAFMNHWLPQRTYMMQVGYKF